MFKLSGIDIGFPSGSIRLLLKTQMAPPESFAWLLTNLLLAIATRQSVATVPLNTAPPYSPAEFLLSVLLIRVTLN